MATFKLTTVKASPFRGTAAELWSNSYHFSGGVPADAAAWSALALAVWAVEGRFINAGTIITHLVHGYGYPTGAPPAGWSGDYTGGGTNPGMDPVGGGLANSSFTSAPLEACAMLRFQCGISTSTGKPRYIMKYIHDVPNHDLGPTQLGGVTANGTAAINSLWNGSLPGGVVLCAPNGDHATQGHMDPYYRNHQIKRRGKRPTRGA